jgi:hypothetical protein
MSKLTLCIGTFLAGSVLLTDGCSSGPYSRIGYSTVEKDGKLYVFPYGGDDYKSFQQTGTVPKAATAIKAGPNQMTVVAPNDGVLYNYLDLW